jgi:hypothetical protein
VAPLAKVTSTIYVVLTSLKVKAGNKVCNFIAVLHLASYLTTLFISSQPPRQLVPNAGIAWETVFRIRRVWVKVTGEVLCEFNCRGCQRVEPTVNLCPSLSSSLVYLCILRYGALMTKSLIIILGNIGITLYPLRLSHVGLSCKSTMKSKLLYSRSHYPMERTLK